MKRWWLLVVAGVLGIGLAVLLVPSPDTGGEGAERSKRLPRIQSSDVPAVTGDEDWHPVTRRPGSEDEGRTSGRANPPGVVEEGNPLSGALTEARSTPEIRAITKSTTPWVQVNRLLHGVEGDPLVPELVDKSQQLLKDLRDARRDPYDVDYDDLEARQQELAGLIRQTSANDSEMDKALSRVDKILAGYRAEKEQLIQDVEGE